MTETDALRAYARMMNTLSASHLEPLLADDFHYASQWVFEEIESKAAYLAYIRPKLQAIENAGSTVWAEMGVIDGYRGPAEPCVVLAQDEQENLFAVVFAVVADGKVKRLDMCMVPAATQAKRSGEYPE